MSTSYRDLWISEMWRTCPEEPREAREFKRELDAIRAQHVGDAVHKSTAPERCNVTPDDAGV